MNLSTAYRAQVLTILRSPLLFAFLFNVELMNATQFGSIRPCKNWIPNEQGELTASLRNNRLKFKT